MALFYLKKTILAKIETVYGTDPTPTGAANAILARNLSITPLEQEATDRDLIRPYFGGSGQIIGSAKYKIEFEVDFAGGGAAGTAPPWGPLARACAMGETTSVGVSVAYAPISASFESVTIYMNIDGVNHKATGCRGNMGAQLDHEGNPVLKFTFEGLWSTPTDTALPTVTLTAWQKPVPFNKVNTTTCTLHSYAAKTASLSLDLGNTVDFKARVNTSEYVRNTGRKAAGSISIEAESIATKDWFSLARAGTTGALAVTHGTPAGNIIEIAAPAVQLGAPSYSDDNGLTMLNMDLMFLPSSGNDEFTITVK